MQRRHATPDKDRLTFTKSKHSCRTNAKDLWLSEKFRQKSNYQKRPKSRKGFWLLRHIEEAKAITLLKKRYVVLLKAF